MDFSWDYYSRFWSIVVDTNDMVLPIAGPLDDIGVDCEYDDYDWDDCSDIDIGWVQ